jgi:hypothetical protein
MDILIYLLSGSIFQWAYSKYVISDKEIPSFIKVQIYTGIAIILIGPFFTEIPTSFVLMLTGALLQKLFFLIPRYENYLKGKQNGYR